MVLGNHDQFTKNSAGKWEENYNQDLVDNLKLRGITVLQNEKYQDDNIFVYGKKFPGMFYEHREPLEEFIENIRKVDFSESEQFNILLEHSPNYTFDGEFISLFDNLKDVDLTLAGHFHNGLIPWYLGRILPGNFGFVDPYMRFFPKNARGVKQITDTNLGIISAPISTFSKNSGLHKIQAFYGVPEQNILIKKK